MALIIKYFLEMAKIFGAISESVRELFSGCDLSFRDYFMMPFYLFRNLLRLNRSMSFVSR